MWRTLEEIKRSQAIQYSFSSTDDPRKNQAKLHYQYARSTTTFITTTCLSVHIMLSIHAFTAGTINKPAEAYPAHDTGTEMGSQIRTGLVMYC